DAQRRGAAVETILGDARIVMEREIEEDPSPRYDVLILDAFNGDAVPVHLLTEQAFQVYRKLLAPDGILVMNVSNYYLDLKPVARRLAETIGWTAYHFEGQPDFPRGVYFS